MTVSKTFIDTNMFIYALQRDEPKSAPARREIESLLASGQGVISTQVMQEFYHKTRRLNFDQADIVSMLDLMEANLEVIIIRPALIRTAILISQQAQLSFWDALIIAAASDGKCERLLTEDLTDG